MIKGNKGEWSELYVLLRLLAYGKIYAADDQVKKIKNVYFPILKIIREEVKGKRLEYRIGKNEDVEIYSNDIKIKSISKERLKKEADYLYNEIVNMKSRSFEIEQTEKFANEIECYRLSAPSTDKTDIKIQIHDIHTGFEPVCGFSIKSELGSAPTLLNASGANNLMLIDSRMEEIVAQVLLCYYRDNISDCREIINKLEEENPLGFPKKGFYEFKFKKFLCSVALGMMPSKEWDGYDEANGGYIIVSADGEVLVYHIYNRDYFEKYLLDNTKLERGSTSRHGFASLYKEDEKMCMNLNLQVRFK